jgi:hypothetical protein
MLHPGEHRKQKRGRFPVPGLGPAERKLVQSVQLYIVTRVHIL